MFEIIYKDTVLYITNSRVVAFEHVFMEAAKRSLEFYQENSRYGRYGRVDFIFYHADNENELEVFTIIKN